MNMHSRSFPLRILEELDSAIAAASNAYHRKILIAKRACAFARFSAIPDATEDINNLRRTNESFDPRLTAWIIYCEALIDHFERLDALGALNRLKRVYAISTAIGDTELEFASYAWMANCLFVLGNSRAAADQLEKLFRTDRPIEPETLARGHLVLGDLLSWSGQPEAAKHWYQRARLEAVSYGDLAFQSAILFNSASFHVAELTLRECLGAAISGEEVRLTRIEVDSASNLDKAIGKPYLVHLVPVLMAEINILEKQFDRAKMLLNSAVDQLETITPQRLIPKILAERAWTHAMCGQLDRAVNDCERAAGNPDENMDTDDLVIFHARLAQTLAICGLTEKSKQQHDLMLLCKTNLQRMRSELQESLSGVVNLAIEHQQKTRP